MQSELENAKKPLVSIVVPVYNSGKYLRKCLDSLVNQTLKNIEIIAVDDGSTDDSISILKEYKENYPNKVIVQSIAHVHGAGAPRNVAIKIARADYVSFCDADDIMDLHSAELLYNRALEGDCDIVCAPAWHVTGRDKVLYGVLREPISTEKLILSGQIYLWSKLIHKRLLHIAGKIPENISYEDLGYSLVVHSYAKKIGYIDHPIYFYYKRYGSDSNNYIALRNLDTIMAWDYAIKNCNSDYLEYVFGYVARHVNVNLRKRWVFTDRIISHLKKLWTELKDNEIIKNDEYLYNRLERFATLPDAPMARNVFIGGFGGTLSDELIERIQKTAFYDGCNLTILNEQNCSIAENKFIKDAYDASEFDLVNGYFALKFIIEYGGIYLHKRIIIDAPFNYVRYCEAFFSLLDEKNYSQWVFGGMPQSVILKKVLDTFYDENQHGNPFYSLSNRIKDALVERSIQVNSITNSLVTVFSPDVMVCDITDHSSLQPEPHICIHDFTDLNQEEEYITVKKSTLRALTILPNANDELNELKKENALLRNKIRDIEFIK